MTKGYGEPAGMRSRLSGGRGPQRFLLIAVSLVMLVVGLNYWRLMSVNTELTERVHALEEMLQKAHDKLESVESRSRQDREDLRKSSVERQALKDQLEEKEQQLQQQRRDSVQRTAELQQQNDNEQQSRLESLRQQLTSVQQQLANCTSQGCDGRLQQLQFDLDTCRFAQKHGGNAGIHPGSDGDRLMVGKSSLSRLFESGGMAGFQRPAAKSLQDNPAVVQSPTTQNGKVAAVGPPAVAAPAEKAPVNVQMVPEPSKPSVPAPPPPEVAPVEGDVLPDETARSGEDKGEEGAADGDPAAKAAEEPVEVEDPAAAEDAAAGEDAPAEQPPAEDGAGLLSRGEQAKPAETQLQGGADQLDLAYPNQAKDVLESAEQAAEGEEQAPPPHTADAKEAALISGLQELAEVARPVDGDGDVGADPVAPEPKLADFEDAPAVDGA